MPSSIDAGEIPVPVVNQDALFSAITQLEAQATAMRNAASGAQSNWRGLAHVYKAPESGQLLPALDTPVTEITSVASDLDAIGAALWGFAVEGGMAANSLKAAHASALSLSSKTKNDDKWDHDQGLIDENNRIRHQVDTAVVAFMAAERQCANAIEALIGGPQLHAADKNHPNGYGPASIPDNSAMKWGKPVAHNDSAPCGTTLWFTQQEVKVVKGVGTAVWGTIKGLGTLAEVGITSQSRQAWLGVATLLGARGQQAQSQADLALVKGLVDSKDWATDPAKALGESLFNIGTIVIPAGAVSKLGLIGDLGDLSKLGKVGDVGDAGKIAKTLDTIAKVRDGGNFGKIKIIGGKIHIGDVTIGSDGSKIIENGLKDINHAHGGGHVPNIHEPGVHEPTVHDPTTHSPTGAHALPDKNAVASTKHLPGTDPVVAKQVTQVNHAIHPQLQHDATQAWKTADDPTSKRWLDYQAAHSGRAPSKAVVGTWAHTDLDAALKAKAEKIFPHDSGYRIRSEVSFNNAGAPVAHGAKGSLRPDIIVEREVVSSTGRTGWQVVQVYDLKTGARGLSGRWVTRVAHAFHIDRTHIEALRP